MRIEILANGIGSVSQMQNGFKNLYNSISDTIDSLRSTQNKINNVNGGPQSYLTPAVNELQTRIRTEETKRAAVERVAQKANTFISNTIQTDVQVAIKVSDNQKKFFNENYWLRPVVQEEKSGWQKFCDGWNDFWGDVGDALASAWNGIKNFYLEHKKVIDTILIVVGAALSIVAVIFTAGGFGVALVPLLGYLGLSASAATAISIGVGIVAIASTVVASTLNIIDTWAEIDNPVFNGWQTVMNWTSGISNGLYSIGMLFNSVCGVSGKEIATFKNQNYTGLEIRNAVKQDFVIKWKGSSYVNMSNKAKGNYGEMLADKAMREEGYKRVSTDVVTSLNQKKEVYSGGRQAIDGIYSNGSTFIVADAKSPSFNTFTSWTNDGLQMSEPWIRNRLPFTLDDATFKNIRLNTYASNVIQIPNANPINPFAVNIYQVNSTDITAEILRNTLKNVTVSIPNFTLPTISTIGVISSKIGGN